VGRSPSHQRDDPTGVGGASAFDEFERIRLRQLFEDVGAPERAGGAHEIVQSQ